MRPKGGFTSPRNGEIRNNGGCKPIQGSTPDPEGCGKMDLYYKSIFLTGFMLHWRHMGGSPACASLLQNCINKIIRRL